MTRIIKNYLDQIQIGAEQSYKNLAIFPVLSDYVIPFDYLTLDEALSKNLIEVVEIDEGGSVPELKVINKSEIMAMAEIYKKERPAIDDYLENFAMVDSQIGAIFLINGKVVGMDCFGKAETFEKTFKKILESYALDAIDWYDSKVDSKKSKAKVNNFLKTANDAQVETHPSVGLGTDCRLDSKKCTGFSLSHEDQVLHLSVFAREAEDKKPKPSSKMQRFSGRRSTRM